MGRIIVVANQKGGVGKTTTTINLSASLASLGKQVLVIDMDPQGNATSGFGVDKNEVENSVYELLLGLKSVDECLMPKVFKNLSLIPSNINLAAAEMELIEIERREYLLRDILADISDRYDYIFVDCPPSLSLLTINSLCAADSLIIPVQCEYYALEGLTQLFQTVQLVRERLNEKMVIEGLLFTMYDQRTNLSQEVVENVKENVDIYVFKSIIPRNIRLAEAPSYGLPVIEYDRKSAGAEAYMKLAKELIRKKK
jgi:chromosome partitioning protein